MFKVFISRQIYDDPEDSISEILCGDYLTHDKGVVHLYDYKKSSLYDNVYILNDDLIDKIEVCDD